MHVRYADSFLYHQRKSHRSGRSGAIRYSDYRVRYGIQVTNPVLILSPIPPMEATRSTIRYTRKEGEFETRQAAFPDRYGEV